MWTDHLRNLLMRSWHSALNAGGTTGIGIFYICVLGIIVGFLVTVVIEWLRAKRSWEAVQGTLNTWPTYVGTILGLFVLWLGLYVYTVCTTIYQDHQDLIAKNRSLIHQVTELQASKPLPSPAE